MKIIGVTGVMGSGKSSVIEILRLLGVPHYNCDLRAKEIMKTPELRATLTRILGDQTYSAAGELNREFIAKKIFSDSQLKKQVEISVHSALRHEMLEWTKMHSEENYVVVESAILFGSIIEQDMDYVVAVRVNEDELLDRIMARDGLSKEKIEARLSTQMNQKELCNRAHLSILTAKNELLTPKVMALHEKLLSLQAKVTITH